jgi:hypothetical protein
MERVKILPEVLDYLIRKRYADWYRKFLSDVKRKKIDLDSAPQEIQEILLSLQQNALLVLGYERKIRKREELQQKKLQWQR